MRKLHHNGEADMANYRDVIGEKDWWSGWRHYKTKRGAQNYAKKHKGVWIIMDCSPEVMTNQEVEWIGTWVVGRADMYLFYRNHFSDKFDEYYPAVEFWNDAELYDYEGNELTEKELSLIQEEFIATKNKLYEIKEELHSTTDKKQSLKIEFEQIRDEMVSISGKLIIAELNNKSINN